jgi:tetratricopeptide (TPR) repeat protein
MLMQATLLLLLGLRTWADPQTGRPAETATASRDANQVLMDLTREAQDDFQNRRYQASRKKLMQALNLSPRDPRLWTYLGLTDEQLNEIDAAVADFQKVLLILPREAQAFFNLGRLYLIKGNRSRAIEMYGQGLALNQNDLPANQNYALLLMEAGKFGDAIVPLRRLRKLDDSDSSTRATLIECYLKAGNREEGEQEIREFLALPNTAADDKLKLAKLMLEDELPDLAQHVLQRIVQEAPDLTEAHATLGSLLMNLGHYNDAAQQYREAVRLAPQSPEYAMHLAECLILEKHYQDALQFLNTRPEFGSLMEYRFKRGLALYGMRLYGPAIAVFEELDSKEPNLDLIQYYLAQAYNEIAELEKAQVYGKKAIALNPNQASYYVVLGQILRKEGDDRTDEAISTLGKALKLDPSNAPAKQELALCYEKKRDYGKAERLLKEVVLEAPNVVSGHAALSRIYYLENKKEEGDAEKKIIERIEATIESP